MFDPPPFEYSNVVDWQSIDMNKREYVVVDVGLCGFQVCIYHDVRILPLNTDV